MNETMDEGIVWGAMKEIARKNEKNEVSMEQLIFTLRKNKIEQNGRKLRGILANIHRQGKIIPLPSFRFRVDVSGDELNGGGKKNVKRF